MKTVFISGPFTAPTRAGVEQNIRRAEELGLEVAKLGALPIIPHANSSHPDFERVQPYDFWLRGYLRVMSMCDAVIHTEDWGGSPGALVENGKARAVAQPVFYDVASLELWLRLLESPADLYAGTVSGPVGEVGG